jgi:small-conductance mechanosensitive channel
MMKRLRAALEIAAETILLTLFAATILGGVYGALAITTLDLSDRPGELDYVSWEAAITSKLWFGMCGMGFGLVTGMIAGGIAGFLNGIIKATAFFPLMESNMRRFRRTIIAAGIISTAGITSLLVGILFGGMRSNGVSSYSPAEVTVLVLEAAVLATLGAWWVGRIVATWQEAYYLQERATPSGSAPEEA